MKRSRNTVTSGNSSRPRLSTSPTSPKLTNSDIRGADYHQPRDNRKDDDPAARDIAAASSTGGSTTGNAPDPGLRDPTETLPPVKPLYSWARTFPRVPGIRYPFSPFPPLHTYVTLSQEIRLLFVRILLALSFPLSRSSPSATQHTVSHVSVTE